MVGEAEKHLRAAVETGLDVGVRGLSLEARRAKVDELDGGAAGRAEQHILGLEIAMDSVLPAEEAERVEDLDAEPADQRQRDTHKAIVLEEFVQIGREQLQHDAEVASEGEVLEHAHYVGLVVWVTVAQMREDLRLGSGPGSGSDSGSNYGSGYGSSYDAGYGSGEGEDLRFDEGLLVEPLLIADDLDRDHLLSLVVVGTHHLPERAFANHIDDLIAAMARGCRTSDNWVMGCWRRAHVNGEGRGMCMLVEQTIVRDDLHVK